MMMNDNIRIRPAGAEDAEALLAIYAPYVRETAITFEYDVPTVEEFQSRIRNILQKYPYLIAEQDGRAVGYAYAGSFKERASYAWDAETTIYVARDRKRQGIGRRLYRTLEDILKAQGILNLNACIAFPPQEDEYLTRNSMEFHARCGFRLVGEFHQCGYKFGRWYNIIWMEKHIGAHPDLPASPKTFDEVRGLFF